MSANDDTETIAVLQALQDEVARIGTLDHRSLESGQVNVVTLTPHNPAARSVSWATVAETQIVLQVGDEGGRWELDRSPEDVGFLVDVVRSVVAGRVSETFAAGRSHVEVTLADGSQVSETGYSSWFPLPGWRRWGRTVQYEPYRPV